MESVASGLKDWEGEKSCCFNVVKFFEYVLSDQSIMFSTSMLAAFPQLRQRVAIPYLFFLSSRL